MLDRRGPAMPTQRSKGLLMQHSWPALERWENGTAVATDGAEARELLMQIDDELRGLCAEEQSALRLLFGIGGGCHSREEVSRLLGVDRTRLRGVERRALRRLRLRAVP